MSQVTLLAGTAFVRSLEPSDVPFVLDSWIKSYRGSPYAGVVRNCDFHATTASVIYELRERGAEVLVVAAKHNPDQILGWACFEVLDTGDLVLHYVYVKDPFRRKGIASTLLECIRAQADDPEARTYHTFRTRDFAYLEGVGDVHWRWAPEIARRAPGGARGPRDPDHAG